MHDKKLDGLKIIEDTEKDENPSENAIKSFLNIPTPMDEYKKYLTDKLTGFNRLPIETKKEIILDITSVVSPREFADSDVTLQFLNIFFELIKNKEIYTYAIVLLGTICSNAEKFKVVLYKKNVFKLLDFKCDNTYFFIYHFCSNNKTIYDDFMETTYNEKRDGKDERIICLIKSYNVKL